MPDTPTGYNDDPREMLKLMQLVHEEHPVTWCSRPACELRYGEDQETGPETVRLLTRREADRALGVDWVEDTTRSFFYANGMACRNCGSDLGKKVATYGPPSSDPDAPLSAYVLWAD